MTVPARHASGKRLFEVALEKTQRKSLVVQLNHNIGHHQHFMQQGAGSPLRDEYYWLEPDGSVTPRWLRRFPWRDLGYLRFGSGGKMSLPV